MRDLSSCAIDTKLAPADIPHRRPAGSSGAKVGGRGRRSIGADHPVERERRAGMAPSSRCPELLDMPQHHMVLGLVVQPIAAQHFWTSVSAVPVVVVLMPKRLLIS